MTAPSLEKNAKVGDRELVFTRLFNAPPGVVFDVWTNPEHLPHWWGPHGFTTTIQEMDVRPGGGWRLVMHGPDGRDYQNRIVFLEVERPHRLVYKHEPGPGDEPVSFEITVNFANQAGQTLLTMRMLFPTPADREFVLATYHADEGGWQTLARLSDHLASMSKANHHLVFKRVFNAPRALVFKAWTETNQLQQWWGPDGFTNPVCVAEPRQGGRLLIHMRSPDGNEYPMHGTFTEIVEPERLVFVTRVGETVDAPRFEIQNTVTLKEQGPSQTELTLDILVLSANEAAYGNLSGAKIGWTQSLARLAMLLESGSGSEQ